MVVGLSSTEYGVIPNTENIIDRVKSFQREREFLLLVAQVEIIVAFSVVCHPIGRSGNYLNFETLR